MDNDLLQLLREAERISRHHEDVQALTGESFNIFSILQVESDEVRTHSRLLGELLNPRGSHGLGAAFLKLFVAELNLPDCPTAAWSVRAEVHVGPVTHESGGRVDIVISDQRGTRIVVENKIYAGDQENQLLRYHHAAPNAALYYLTLFGDPPAAFSTGGKQIKYTAISYSTHVLNWLQRCRKEASHSPIVRETLTQYLFLVRKLTNQNTSAKMTDEIINYVLQSEDHFASFFTLSNSYEPVLDQVFAKLEVQVQEVAASLGLRCSYNLSRYQKETGFSLHTPALDHANLGIEMAFGRSGPDDFYFGFYQLTGNGIASQPPSLRKRFAETFGQTWNDSIWVCWSYWEDPWKIWTSDTYREIYFDRFREVLRKRVIELLDVFDVSLRETAPVS